MRLQGRENKMLVSIFTIACVLIVLATVYASGNRVLKDQGGGAPEYAGGYINEGISLMHEPGLRTWLSILSSESGRIGSESSELLDDLDELAGDYEELVDDGPESLESEDLESMDDWMIPAEVAEDDEVWEPPVTLPDGCVFDRYSYNGICSVWEYHTDIPCKQIAMGVLRGFEDRSGKIVESGYLDVSNRSWGCVYELDDYAGSMVISVFPRVSDDFLTVKVSSYDVQDVPKHM